MRTVVYRINYVFEASGTDGGTSSRASYESTREAVNGLVKLVKRTATDADWDDAKDRWIHGIPGVIVVRHDQRVQKQVHDVLDKAGVLLP